MTSDRVPKTDSAAAGGGGTQAGWPVVAARAGRDPDRVAVVAGDRRVTCAALFEAARAVAAALPSGATAPVQGDRAVGSGVATGRVLITARDPVRVLERVLGAWSAGLVPAVMHEGMQPGKLARASEILAPVATLSGDDPVLAPARAPTPTPAPGRTPDTVAATSWPAPATDPRREGLILSTSGSSGDPKLFAVPMRTIDLHARLVADLLRLTANDRLLVPTPLSHSHGLVGGVMAGLLAGAEVHLFRAGLPAPVLQGHMRRAGVTAVQGLPSFFRLFFPYWNGTPFPDIRLVSVGGEPTSPELAARMAAAFPNAERAIVYGLAEAGTRISQISLDDPRALQGAVGKPLPHFECKLLPVAGQPDGTGELAVRGPSVFLGYLQPGGGYAGLEPDGFLRTRDLVRIDEGGQLHPLGRLDSMFKVGGRLVNPLEVEAAARRAAGAAEVMCLPIPHALLGHVPTIQVVPATFANADAVRAAVMASCEAELESWKRPTEVRLVDALSRGATGKVRRGGPA